MSLETKVGVAVMIVKDGKVLLGKRKTSHGAGEYSFPGGHLEYMELFSNCAIRETREECGIEIQNIKFLLVANLTQYAPKHYCNICLIADWKDGEVKLLEPDRYESWDWYDIDSLPSPLFASVPFMIESYKTGKNYYDSN
jgi:8-oxo-dGTP diphosphatase